MLSHTDLHVEAIDVASTRKCEKEIGHIFHDGLDGFIHIAYALQIFICYGLYFCVFHFRKF